MIHEGLHSVSGALTSGRLDARNRAWEEGIVEQTQRLLRQGLLQDLAVVCFEEQFHPDDIQHPHNGYIRALEQLRAIRSAEMESFYRRLLRSDVAGRAADVVAAARALGVQQQREAP